VLLSAVLVAACGPCGSETTVTETRDVGAFDSIEVSGGIDVRLTVDPGAETSVAVVFDDNLLDHIVTDVDGSKLEVHADGSFNIFGSGRFVEVVTPTLVEVSASGGSDLTGVGEVETLAINASGGADVDLTDLIVATANVEASGGANVTVEITEQIQGEVSGGADLTILGEPTSQNIETSGGADVHNG